jgi:hypothetical protein
MPFAPGEATAPASPMVNARQAEDTDVRDVRRAALRWMTWKIEHESCMTLTSCERLASRLNLRHEARQRADAA